MTKRKIKLPVLIRFLSKVMIPNDNGCWLWAGSKNDEGYGYFGYNGKPSRAHRVSYQLYIGPIPEGKWILHSCDNPSCVSPFHLRAGTAQENVDDMLMRDRQPSRKISLEDVLFIRANPQMTTKELAAQFNVSYSHIWHVQHYVSRTNPFSSGIIDSKLIPIDISKLLKK